MARVALLLIVVVGVFGTSSGYQLQQAKDYVSKMYQKASSFVRQTPLPPYIPPAQDAQSIASFARQNPLPPYIQPAQESKSSSSFVRQEPLLPPYIPSAQDAQTSSSFVRYEPLPPYVPPAQDSQSGSSFVRQKPLLPPYIPSAQDAPFVCQEDGLFANPDNCGSYVRCVNGVDYILPCANSQHFNPRTGMCETPCEAHCDTSLACECSWDDCESTTVDRSELFAETTEENTERPAERSWKKNKLSRRKFRQFTCPKDGLYNHPSDCTKYIECSNGRSYVMSCPVGLHYSDTTERCESPCVVRCDPTLECGRSSLREDDVCSRPPYKGDCDVFSFRHYYSSAEGKCKKFMYSGCRSNGNNFKSHEECLRECAPSKYHLFKRYSDFHCVKDGLYPNPENCSTYIQCSNGQDYAMPCPENLHFSQQTERCESPCDARCDPSIAETCGWDTKEYSHAKPGFDFTCVKDGFYTNPEDCATYIQCSNGNAYVTPCPEKKHFSQETQRCEDPCDALCGSVSFLADECGRDSEAHSLKQPLYDFNCIKDGLFTNPEDCATYIQCSNGNAYIMPCPHNLHFNHETQRCETPCDAHCDPSIADECEWNTRVHSLKQPFYDFDCIKDGLFTNPEDCTTYIQCSNGNAYSMPCPKNLHFNHETQRCETPCDAHCDLSMADECGWNTRAEEEVDCNAEPLVGPCNALLPRYYYDEDSGLCRLFYYSGCGGSSNNFISQSECRQKCQKERSDFKKFSKHHRNSVSQPLYDFTCVKNGLYKNPKDCSVYILCSNGSPYTMPCPKNLHFSEETLRCESPCNAHCDPSIAEECGWDESWGTERTRHMATEDSWIHQRPTEDSWSHQLPTEDSWSHQLPTEDSWSHQLRTEDSWNNQLPTEDAWSHQLATEDSWNHQLATEDSWNHQLPTEDTWSHQLATEDSWNHQLATEDSWNHQLPTEDAWSHQLATEDSWNHQLPTEDAWSHQISTEDARSHQISTEDAWSHQLSTEDSWSPDTDSPSEDSFRIRSPSTCIKDGLYKNSEDCSTYIQCSNGKSYVMPCPKTLHFSEETLRCEFPCDARCDPSLAEECRWDETTTLPSGEEEIDCETEVKVESCTNAIPGFYYHRESGRCRFSEYSGCGGNSNNFFTREECEEKCQKKLLGGYRCSSYSGKFGHYPDCMSYYECKRGIPTLKRCPKGTAFDHKKSKCVTEYEATCVYECRDPDAVYSIKNDCRRYIDCVNGISKVERCPRGQAFDPERRDCVDEKSFSCRWS